LLYFEVLMEESVKGREKIGMNFLDGLIMEFSKQEQTNAFILVSTKTWKIQIQWQELALSNMIPRSELSIYYEEVDLTVFGGSRIRNGFGFDPSCQNRGYNTACNTHVRAPGLTGSCSTKQHLRLASAGLVDAASWSSNLPFIYSSESEANFFHFHQLDLSSS
jgi:hypothetical protein